MLQKIKLYTTRATPLSFAILASLLLKSVTEEVKGHYAKQNNYFQACTNLQ